MKTGLIKEPEKESDASTFEAQAIKADLLQPMEKKGGQQETSALGVACSGGGSSNGR